MFYRADIVMGAHGAGMSNILVSRPGTTVIEVFCKGKEIRMCYRLLAQRLGMRYFASETTDEEVTWRCEESGIRVDIEELEKVLDYVATYL